MQIVVEAAVPAKSPAMTAEEAADPNVEYVFDQRTQQYTKQLRATPRPMASADNLNMLSVFKDQLTVAEDLDITPGDKVMVNASAVGKVIRITPEGTYRVQIGNDENHIITAWKQELAKLKQQ
jgi:hypothetical protein